MQIFNLLHIYFLYVIHICVQEFHEIYQLNHNLKKTYIIIVIIFIT